jgi:hypothetical protein
LLLRLLQSRREHAQVPTEQYQSRINVGLRRRENESRLVVGHPAPSPLFQKHGRTGRVTQGEMGARPLRADGRVGR